MKEYSYGICPYYKVQDEIYIMLIQPKGHVEWGFAKGKIEENESREECAVREFYEETGLTINKAVLENYFEQKNKRKDVGIFLVNIFNMNKDDKINLQSKEVHKIKLFNITDKIDIYKNQEIILNDIIKYLSNIRG
jgi:8-oxo-dGTP pyrophosphatase MutT (NUDIX family)